MESDLKSLSESGGIRSSETTATLYKAEEKPESSKTFKRSGGWIRKLIVVGLILLFVVVTLLAIIFFIVPTLKNLTGGK